MNGGWGEKGVGVFRDVKGSLNSQIGKSGFQTPILSKYSIFEETCIGHWIMELQEHVHVLDHEGDFDLIMRGTLT